MSGGVDCTRDHAVGVAHVDHHRAEVGDIANLVASLLDGHALLGAQACEFLRVALRVCGVVNGNDGSCRDIQAKLRSACVDCLRIAEQYQIGNSTFKNNGCCAQDTIVFRFGQDDALAVGTCAVNKIRLEGKGGNNLGSFQCRGRIQSLCVERQFENGKLSLNVRGDC